AGILLLLHTEVETAMLDELVDLFEGLLVDKQLDAFSCSEFAVGLLTFEPLLAAAKFRGTIHFKQPLEPILRSMLRHRHYLMTGTFSQSFRNCSTPRSVNGCFNICSKTFAGRVQISAPRSPACTT